VIGPERVGVFPGLLTITLSNNPFASVTQERVNTELTTSLPASVAHHERDANSRLSP